MKWPFVSRKRLEDMIDLEYRTFLENGILTSENVHLHAALTIEQRVSKDEQALHEAAREWLEARIAFINRGDLFGPQFGRYNVAGKELDKAARRCFLKPGMQGSWGRGVPHDWACDLDGLKGRYCECAGGGMTDAECRTCFYRPSVGAK